MRAIWRMYGLHGLVIHQISRMAGWLAATGLEISSASRLNATRTLRPYMLPAILDQIRTAATQKLTGAWTWTRKHTLA